MLDLNWSKSIVEDPVKLADYIELTIAIDHGHPSYEFTYANFVSAIRDEPHGREDDTGEVGDSFPDGDEVDEAKEHFENAVSLIERRSHWLGNLYPFMGGGDGVRLTSESADRNAWMPYVFLLACSHHSLINCKGLRLDTEFENICKEAMKALFNESADVFLFSQFSEDRKELGRPAREAVKNLAEKLNTTLSVSDEEVPLGPNEFGIDIVAIDALDDVLGYPLFAFAQCTVSGDPQEWARKKDEAQPSRGIGAYIHLNIQQSNILFVPHLPRMQADKWSVRLDQITNCVFCDRYRICKALQRLRNFNDSEPHQNTNGILDGFTDHCGAKLSKSNLFVYATNGG